MSDIQTFIAQMKTRFRLDSIISLDFETFYGRGYGLKNKTYAEYIMDERFRAQMLGIGEDDGDIDILDVPDIDAWADSIKQRRVSGERIGIIAQNTHFDAAILCWRYGLTFDFYFDAMLLSRLRFINRSAALKAHAERLWPDDDNRRKGDELHKAEGIEDLHSVQGLFDGMSAYCRQDVALTRDIVLHHWAEGQVPDAEWDLMHITLRGCVEPQVWINQDLLDEVVFDDQADKVSKVQAASDYLVSLGKPPVGADVFASNDKYKALLAEFGAKLPYKLDPETYEMKPALGKTDPEYVKFQQENPELQPLFAARETVKSTIATSRAKRLQTTANLLPLDGFITFPLAYHKAHTGRWCLTPDHEVLTPTGWVRMDEWDGEPIMQFHADSTLTWCTTPRMNVFACNEPLVRMENTTISAAMTRDHKMVNLRRDTGAVTLRPADEVRHLSNFDIPQAGTFIGGLNISAAETTLLCAAQADGSWQKERLSFGLRRTDKIHRLEWALCELGVTYRKTVGETGGKETVFISAHYSDLPDVLAYLSGEEKEFDWRLLDLDGESKARFLDELGHWDGWEHQRNGAVNYSTCSHRNASFVQALAHISGRKVGFHTRLRQKESQRTAYQLYMKTSSALCSVRKENFTLEAYTGDVYCPTVGTGMFLVRHKDRVHVTGNSGSEKINVQNLQQRSKHRRSLTAKAGHVITVRDLSGIEMRMNLWFCEQDDLLDLVRQGGDIYCKAAEGIYGHPINKKDHPLERQVGKVEVLGLGYGMGWKTFQATMAGGPMGMDPIFFPDSFCKQVKSAYDRDNPMIKHMWNFLSNVVIPAMCDPLCDMEVGRHGCVKARYQKLILPSGRELQYPDLHCHMLEHARGVDYVYRYDDGTRDRYKNVVWKKLYGGLLLENIIQAIARDVIAGHLLQIEDYLCETGNGWVIGSVHDEILSMVLETKAETAYDQMGVIMATPPHWCFDLPLASEGGWDTVYSK